MNRFLFAILAGLSVSPFVHAQAEKPADKEKPAQKPADKNVLPPPKELPQQDKGLLPPPTEIPHLPTIPYVTPIHIYDLPPRIGQRNAWELYSVNSRGQFVPRRPPANSDVVPYVPHKYYFVPPGQSLPELPLPQVLPGTMPPAQ